MIFNGAHAPQSFSFVERLKVDHAISWVGVAEIDYALPELGRSLVGDFREELIFCTRT